MRLEDYLQSCLEALRLNRPALFWDHLVRASSLGHLGEIEEGCKAAASLLKLKPDFAARGRILMRRFIKFDEILERTISGLSEVGVEVDP
jgi:hypothetical protein